jgi:serine/threonine-protein kinase
MTHPGFGGDPFGGKPFGDPFGGGVPGGPPIYSAPPPSAPPQTNTLATLSVVFAFVFAPAGAVLGHLGLSQIKRTGQPGRDRAIVGIALSYTVIVAVIVSLIAWAAIGGAPSPDQPTALGPASASPTAVAPAIPGQTDTPGQTKLPFTGSSGPRGMAVDAANNLYVAWSGSNQIMKMDAATKSMTELPVSDLQSPQGVAVDTAGNLYFTEALLTGGRVRKLSAATQQVSELPFTGLGTTSAIAVDDAGNVFVAHTSGKRVLKLTAATGAVSELPLQFPFSPTGVAADGDGNLYVSDPDRVVRLDAGSGAANDVNPWYSFPGLRGIAVDGYGAVYIVEHDHNMVVKHPPGHTAAGPLPFRGLDGPVNVAVNAAGTTVYVSDETSVYEFTT